MNISAKVSIRCVYCGKKWYQTIYSKNALSGSKCAVCGQNKLEVEDVTESKIDYYQGSSPFPTKELPVESGWPWDTGSID